MAYIDRAANLVGGRLARRWSSDSDSSGSAVNWTDIIVWLADNGASLFAKGYLTGNIRATSSPARWGNKRYNSLRSVVDLDPSFVVPDADDVFEYIKDVANSGNRNSARRRVERASPNVHAMALYLLWAWLPSWLTEVYSNAGSESDETLDKYERLEQAYDGVDGDALLNAIDAGRNAMQVALDDVTDDGFEE
jgi:hypothetical protein